MSARRRGDVRFGHVADLARPHDLCRHPVALMGEALVSHLRGHLVLHGGFLQQARLPGSSRERLFQVDVFAVLHAGQRHRGMHEVRNPDGAGVDVLPFSIEHHAEVFVFGRLVEALQIRRGAVLVHIAQGDDIFRSRRIQQIHATLSSTADGRHVELFIERLVAQRFERWHTAVTTGRNRAGEQRSEEEMTSGNSVVRHYRTSSPC